MKTLDARIEIVTFDSFQSTKNYSNKINIIHSNILCIIKINQNFVRTIVLYSTFFLIKNGKYI